MKFQFLALFSSKKLRNSILVLGGFLMSNILRKPFKLGFPVTISVEPVNFCNLSCPECTAGNGNLSRNPGQMDANLYANFIKEIKNYVSYLTLYFQGEPLLHPQFIEFVQLATQHRIFTASSTNAQIIDDVMAKKIVKSGLKKLIISMDGTTQKIYEKYRVGGSLALTEKGILSLIKWKKELNSSTPFVELQFLVLKHNEHQIPEIKKRAKSLGVNKLSLKTAQITNFEKGSNLLPTQTKYARYIKTQDGNYKRKKIIYNRCWRAFSGAVITVDGNVLPCSFDKNGEHAFGNINEQSLAEIWHSEKAHLFRKQVLRDRKAFSICQNCTM